MLGETVKSPETARITIQTAFSIASSKKAG
nr:hypothetical protein [Escherichia coli]